MLDDLSAISQEKVSSCFKAIVIRFTYKNLVYTWGALGNRIKLHDQMKDWSILAKASIFNKEATNETKMA